MLSSDDSDGYDDVDDDVDDDGDDFFRVRNMQRIMCWSIRGLKGKTGSSLEIVQEAWYV